MRLIGAAIDWLRTGEPALEATGAFRDRLLGIKRGEVSLDETLREAEALAPELEAARAGDAAAPARPTSRRADALLRRIGEEMARRPSGREPGPFGRDAPAAAPRWCSRTTQEQR